MYLLIQSHLMTVNVLGTGAFILIPRGKNHKLVGMDIGTDSFGAHGTFK